MSAILAILTAAILIVIGVLRAKHPRKKASPVIVRRYHHRGHAWVRETGDGDVIVGIDDFAQALIGSVDEVRLPRLLRKLNQGSAAFEIRHGERVVPIMSPIAGRIVAKNEMIATNPSLLNTSPYGDGWLVRIKPANLQRQTGNLFSGKEAQQWLDAARARLHQIFVGTPALMYQDGGELVRNLSDKCSDREWEAIVNEFFLGESQSVAQR